MYIHATLLTFPRAQAAAASNQWKRLLIYLDRILSLIRLWGCRETQCGSTCKGHLVGEEALQSPLLTPCDPCRVIMPGLIGRKTSQGRCPWVVHCKVNESLFSVE